MKWLAVMLLAAVAPAATAQVPTVHQSYARARALLDSSVVAYGGQPALDAARQIRVQIRGVDHWLNQSRAVDPPFDREASTSDIMIDIAQGRLINTASSTYPGDIHRAWRWITDRDSSYTVNLRALTFENSQFPRADVQTGNLFRLPHWIVIKARESGTAVRYLGRMRTASGAEVEAISTNTQNQHLTIGFDPQTKLVRVVMSVAMDMIAGEITRESEFVDYRTLNGVVLPTRLIEWIGSGVRREHTFTNVTTNFSVPDSLARPPAATRLAARTDVAPVRLLAPGVWLVGGGSSALAVEFRDHLLVVDAPYNTRDIMTRLDSLAPGKPIRYAIPTHHHDDHSIGARDLAAAGATIVTTAGNRGYFERIARNPRIELVNGGRRTFSDGSRTVEIHQFASPHANEMLVAWLPQEGILFQGDLIDTRADGTLFRGANNATTQHFADWLKRRSWNVRVFAGGHGTLPSADVFAELLQQPIIP